MEKVMVSKKVAETIESLRGVVDDVELIKIASAECGGENPILTVAIAIHYGYEIEKPPAEIILAKFNTQRAIHSELYVDDMTDTTEYAYASGYMDAILDFAKVYEINIEGVTNK